MKILRTIYIFLFLSLVCFGDERPNIIFIFADDWGGDLGCHGHPYLKTPNIDRLAEEGPIFTDFRLRVCGYVLPAEPAVMTGHFPARYSIDGHFARVPSNQKRICQIG